MKKTNLPVKLAIIAMPAILLFASVSHAATGTNLINNPSVEQRADTNPSFFFALPSGWKKTHDMSNLSFFSYPVPGYNSPKAIKVQVMVYKRNKEGWYFNDVPASPAQQYTFSDYYISNVTSYISASFKLSNGTSTSTELGQAPASSQWSQFSTTITPPANAVSVSILHYLKSVGTLTTDVYSLTAGSTTNPSPDTTAPQVSIQSPTSGSSFSQTITIQATATDPTVSGQTTSGVKQVQFYVDGSLFGNPVSASPYQISLDTTKFLNGAHVLGATATDNQGNASIQATVQVTFSNSSTTDSNLVPNPLLENGTTFPTSWVSGQWGTNDAVFNYPVAGFTGNGASVTINNYTSGDAKWYFNNIAVTPGKYYVFSDEYTSNVSTQVLVQFQHADSSVSYQQLGSPAAISAWQNFQAGFTVPLDVSSLTIFHLLNTVGALTVDNYSVIQSTNPNAFNKGMVSLTFDDDWQSIYDNAIPVLNSANFKSTQYIINNTVGDTTDGYMSLAEVLNMYQSGQDIASHTMDHIDLVGLPQSQLQYQIWNSRNNILSDIGKPSDNFAYPLGLYDAPSEAEVQNSGFLGARTVDPGYNDKSTNRLLLKQQAVERGGSCLTEIGTIDNEPAVTLAQVENWIDTAAATNTWLILTFHQIDNNTNTNTNCYGTTPDMFQSIINYLKTSNVNVVTVSQGLHQMPGVPSTGDTIAPKIATHTDVTASSTSSSGATVSFAAPAVTDNTDTGLAAACESSAGLTSGSVFPIGTTAVTCNAADTSGNLAAPISFNITVTP